MRPRNDTAQIAGAHKTDSPVGQAAWLYEKYEQWTDHDGDPEALLIRDEMLDEMLDNIALYRLPATAPFSARIYWQSMRSFREHEIAVPVAVILFRRDIHLVSRRWGEERYLMLVHFNQLSEGNHFAAWEPPELFAEEIRADFRSLR